MKLPLPEIGFSIFTILAFGPMKPSMQLYHDDMYKVFCTVCAMAANPKNPKDDSVSYHRFTGPVSGEIQEVLLANPSRQDPNGKTKDYVAKPDYAYSYGVRDPITGNAQEHSESRDGDSVSGQYTVLQADGTMRIVKYTAGGTDGFRAVVEYVKPDGTRHTEQP